MASEAADEPATRAEREGKRLKQRSIRPTAIEVYCWYDDI
jgi:hypothetical protein